jgi:hypothetical protein
MVMTHGGSLNGTLGTRVLGAGIAAGLAFAVLWAGWTVAHRFDPVGALGLEAVLGIDGIAGGNRTGQVLAWATGPIGAAIGGWLCAPAAVGHRWRHGANMGAMSYVFAIMIAPVAGLPAALSPTEFGTLSVGSAVSAVPFLWIVSGIVLAPLLIVCIVSGWAWAGLLGIARGPIGAAEPVGGAEPIGAAEPVGGAEPIDAQPPSVWFPVFLVALLALAWLGGFSLFGWLLNSGGAAFD